MQAMRALAVTLFLLGGASADNSADTTKRSLGTKPRPERPAKRSLGATTRRKLSDYCFDTTYGAKDRSDDGCDYYDQNSDHCGYFDDGDVFLSNKMCCACGGGITCNEDKQYVENGECVACNGEADTKAEITLKDPYNDGWGSTTLNLYSGDSGEFRQVTLKYSESPKTVKWCNPNYAAWGSYGIYLQEVSVQFPDETTVTAGSGTSTTSNFVDVGTPFWCSGGGKTYTCDNGTPVAGQVCGAAVHKCETCDSDYVKTQDDKCELSTKYLLSELINSGCGQGTEQETAEVLSALAQRSQASCD